jgi:hypothetical protein
VKLFINGIAKNGDLKRAHAWDNGFVTLLNNTRHRIKQTQQAFHSIAQLGGAVEKALKKKGDKLHHRNGSRSLYQRAEG